VHGASLFCNEVSTIHEEPFDPLDAVDPNESKTRYVCAPSEVYSEPPADEFGVLHHSLVYNAETGELRDANESSALARREKSHEQTPGRKDEATARNVHFCFKLPAQTDVSACGGAVVFDEIEPGHCTLIPWPIRPDKPQSSVLWKQEPVAMLFRDPPKDSVLSEYKNIYHSTGICLSMPFIARQFSLAGIVLQASGDPDLLDVDEAEKRGDVVAAAVLRGVVALVNHYSYMVPLEVQSALDALCDNDWHVSGLPISMISLLEDAVMEVMEISTSSVEPFIDLDYLSNFIDVIRASEYVAFLQHAS